MQKKIAVFLIAALLPLLAWAGVTGLPSKPTFMQVKAYNTAPSGSTENIAAVVTSKTDTAGGESARSARFAVISHADDRTLNNSTAVISLGIQTGAATANPSYTGTRRWHFTKTGTAESGSNIGSDFEIQAFNDAGSHLWYPIKITRSTGVVAFEKSPVSTKTCSAGFTRVAPNYCAQGTATNLLATVGTCVDLGNISDATGRHFVLDVQITSANSAAARSVSVGFYTDSGCTVTTGMPIHAFQTREFSAVADGTIIHEAHTTTITGANHRYAKIVSNAGGTSTGIIVNKIGYFD